MLIDSCTEEKIVSMNEENGESRKLEGRSYGKGINRKLHQSDSEVSAAYCGGRAGSGGQDSSWR